MTDDRDETEERTDDIGNPEFDADSETPRDEEAIEDERPRSAWGGSFAEIQDAVGGLVDSALRNVAPASGRFPRYDLVASPDAGYLILFDLPGLEKSDVDVSAASGEVTVSGTRTRPNVPAGAAVERSERPYGRFRRTVRVPGDIDLSGIRAKMENGVLEVRLPFEEPEDARTIRVD